MMSQASMKGYLSLPTDEKGNEEPFKPSSRSTRNLKLIAVSSFLALSIAINVLLAIQLPILKSPPKEVTEFAGLAADEYITYHSRNEFSIGNDTELDKAWNTISTDPVAIALSDEYAEDHGLQKAARFPWDFSKGLYAVWAFHDIHCLKVIRNDIVEYRRGTAHSLGPEHINHCLDVLRQSIMCTANDLPMNTVHGPDDLLGDGQVRQCRSWEKLTQWAQDPERYACYRSLNDFHNVKNGLELYAFCPKDSPYYEHMSEYFEKYGHHDPFEERPSGMKAS